MKNIIVLVLCCIGFIANAQKTIVKKDYRGRVYKTYQVNSNGDYHGTLTEYFDNGFVAEQETYVQGKRRSSKVYEYINNVRYLTYIGTYDNKGKVLTKFARAYNTRTVQPLIQVVGLLKNGQWFLDPNGPYTEEYLGNDTTYTWSDRTKSELISKFVDQLKNLNK